MRTLFIHPSPLMYSEIFLRLEPLGVERVAQAARQGAADDGQPRRVPPARDLMRRRRKYFIGVLDSCASIEFTRGCPWDCSFRSAWTF